MDNRKNFVRNEELSIYGLVKKIATHPNYVNLCIITKISNEDFVDVKRYYSDKMGTNQIITDVRILHLGTDKCKVIVEPAIGDYVLLLTPRDFVEELDYSAMPTPKQASEGYEPYADYNACGILIKADGDENVNVDLLIDQQGTITFNNKGDLTSNTEGTVTMSVKPDGEDKPSVSMTIDPDGNTTIRGKGTVSVTKTDGDDEDLVALNIDEDGNSTLRTKGTVSATKTDGDDGDLISLNIDEDGNTTIESEGSLTSSFKGAVEKTTEDAATITIKGDATITVNGNAAMSVDGDIDVEATKTGLITIKNSIDSLGALLAAVIDQINTFSQNVQSIDTVGSPAAHSAGPGIIANMVTLQTQLAQLKQKAGQVLG